jgi:hypothetical protein
VTAITCIGFDDIADLFRSIDFPKESVNVKYRIEGLCFSNSHPVGSAFNKDFQLLISQHSLRGDITTPAVLRGNGTTKVHSFI